jgi:DNA polymerase-3 subunit alpha
MFDLWGESVPVPLPSLELEAIGVPLRERMTWEKDLLGAYLSEHPFTQAARQLAPDTTAFCGQIDAEMAGQMVTVAGTVTSARQLLTKSKRPFAAAVLEDLTGSIEVTCWPEVYQRTEGLWAEENILLVRGKVKVRGDGVQLVCEDVRQHRPGIVEPIPEAPPPKAHQLLITINQTENEQDDLAQFHRILDIIKGYLGQDKVRFAITTNEGVINLEMPNFTTGYCPELHQQLVELIGEKGLSVEDSRV